MPSRDCFARTVLAGTIIAAMAGPAHAAPTSPEAFAQAMTAMIRKELPDQTLTGDPADPLHVKIVKTATTEERHFYFDRIYRFCQQATPTDCEATKRQFVKALVTIQPPPAANHLRYAVRNAAYIDGIRAMDREHSGSGIGLVRPIGDDLYMVLVIDAKDTISIIGTKTLNDLGLSEEVAWDLAMAQTRAVIPRLPEASAVRKQWQGYEGKEYLGSLLALTDDWAELAQAVGPDLFVTVVSDQLVIIGVLPPGQRLNDLAKAVAADCQTQQRCISDHIYRFRDGKWVIAN